MIYYKTIDAFNKLFRKSRRNLIFKRGLLITGPIFSILVTSVNTLTGVLQLNQPYFIIFSFIFEWISFGLIMELFNNGMNKKEKIHELFNEIKSIFSENSPEKNFIIAVYSFSRKNMSKSVKQANKSMKINAKFMGLPFSEIMPEEYETLKSFLM